MRRNLLGHQALERGDYQEAVNIFMRGLEQTRDAEGLLGLAAAYKGLGEPDRARWAVNQVLALDAHHAKAIKALEELERDTGPRPPKKPGSLWRTGENHFELNHHGRWSKVFLKAINIGLGLPGFFPGEYAIGKKTYHTWFQQIAELGVNAIRIYTVHPPSFYEAFRQFNESGARLFLFQGIWAELPEGYNFDDHRYVQTIQESIKRAVDVIYGNARIPEEPGLASGHFDVDVSRYTAGFIFGREWESCAVKGFNELLGRKLTNYEGAFLRMRDGSPFELWLTKTCDFLQSYEQEIYHASHPVSAVNWATLDPLVHPSESTYEEELILQGMNIPKAMCSENEDVESVDFAKITSRQGGGIFATYHVYPYYPDFLNNDYISEENPYLAYLRALKGHHGSQPVLIAEFGVPSSRDVSHWQKNGWHHGGHTEAQQGAINGKLMQSIHEAGMAGGVLFSWFDEWFKRSWVFSSFEIPGERKPCWYNIQDAEENYGLLAAYPGYPGKRVTLSGRSEEWSSATVLCEKTETEQCHAFQDGFDYSRTLVRLMAQHDEGFLYLMIETKGPIDFSRAHYVVGLDTCCLDAGETLLPFKTNVQCPIGLKFLIHLAGETASRILVCKSYDKYFNRGGAKIRAVASDQGSWVMMLNKTNTRRISKDKKTYYPSHVFSMSSLRCGSLDPKSSRYNSLSDFSVHENKLELRIPWGLINFTDPSSRRVLWVDKDGETRKTEGVRVLAASYKPVPGFPYAVATGGKQNITDSLPRRMTREAIPLYTWEEYTTPLYHTYLKESYGIYKNFLSKIRGALS